MNDDDNCVCRMINGCFVCKLNYNIIYNTINSHLYNVEDVSILTRDYLLNSFSSRLVYRRIFRTDIGILLHEVRYVLMKRTRYYKFVAIYRTNQKSREYFLFLYHVLVYQLFKKIEMSRIDETNHARVIFKKKKKKNRLKSFFTKKKKNIQ